MTSRRTVFDVSAVTRRQFLGTSAQAVIGAGAGAFAMRTYGSNIPTAARAGRTRPDAWIPEPLPADQLRALALVAMEAARDAGAEFADVRIGTQRQVLVYADWYGGQSRVELSIGYGIRAWFGGTWSFQYGNVFTAEAVAATARSAVASARRSAKINVGLAAHRHARLTAALASAPLMSIDWVPAPVVTGSWEVPVTIDPFTVPIDDYQRVIGGLADATVPPIYRTARVVGWNLQWRAETRVFASTAGSLVTQNTMCGGLSSQGTAKLPPYKMPGVFMQVPNLENVCAGFELALRPELPAQMRQLHDELVRWEELPFRPFTDVGRFPMVFDGKTMAGVFGNTVNAALDGDRVSGLEADASGGTFLSPAEEILNAETPTFSPLLTARVSRTLPSPMAVQWDDDGVVPDEYTILDQGRVVDFHTTRETAPMLADWYRRHQRPLRSHGSSVAPTPASVPYGSGGHATVAPARGRAGVFDLIRDMSHGFLIFSGSAGGSPGLSEGSVWRDADCLMLEIQRGVPVARTSLRTQFRVLKLLKKDLLALGDETTLGTENIETWKGIPWQIGTHFVTAPAALVKDVEVVL